MSGNLQVLKRWLWPDSTLAKVVVGMLASIVLGLGLFYQTMKRPQFGTELVRVVDEGEWLRIEYKLKNRSAFSLALPCYDSQSLRADRGFVHLSLVFDDAQRPGRITDERTSAGGSGDIKVVKPGETFSGLAYLHQDLGDNAFRSGIIPNSGGWLLEWIEAIESKWSARPLLSSQLRPVQNYGEPLVPNKEISETRGKSLLQRSREFLNTISADQKRSLQGIFAYEQLVQFAETGELPVWLGKQRVENFARMQNEIFELHISNLDGETIRLLEALKEKRSYQTRNAER